jgi:hypothetical protein
MIRKIASVAALAIATIPMIALTANMAQAISSKKVVASTASAENHKVRFASIATVNGNNVKVVTHAQGAFKDVDDGNWEETDLQNNIRFNFKEVRREPRSVYLLDKSRNVNIQLDLSRKRIVYSDSSNKFDLYRIARFSHVRPPYPITVSNKGLYMATYGLSYTLDGEKIETSDLSIPSDAVNVKVYVRTETGILWDRHRTFYSKEYSTAKSARGCFSSYGTTYNASLNKGC